jgi:uncharacterized protein (TIGR03435 family)
MRILRKSFLGIALTLALAFGQTTFEVASIKPAPPLNRDLIRAGQMHIGLKIDKARLDIGNMSLGDLIRFAYNVKRYQVSGPDWMNELRFDVLATLPEGATPEQAPQMMQALLAERFKLAVHRESKEHAVFALVVGKGGVKMKESAPDSGPPATTGTGQVQFNGNVEGKGVTVAGGPAGPMRMQMSPNGNMRMEAAKMTMPILSDMLSRFVDRPVVDMTELKGSYQVALELAMEDLRNIARTAGVMIPGSGPAAGGEAGRPADAASDPSGSSIFAAVQQLGLKLDARKAPMEMIFIDHLEKAPSDN